MVAAPGTRERKRDNDTSQPPYQDLSSYLKSAETLVQGIEVDHASPIIIQKNLFVLMRYSILLLAFALAPAAIASPSPASRIKAAEPSAIPVALRQAVTLDQDRTPASLAQAEPQGDPAMSASPSSGPSEAEKTAELAKEAQNPIANLISLPF
jgi:hypothetical protein